MRDTGAATSVGTSRGEAGVPTGQTTKHATAPVLTMDGTTRVWTVTTTTRCNAERHDTISAYKNHGCRCPQATRRSVGYERRRETGQVRPSQPATLTTRRLQALAVLGWPSPEIARMVNRNPVSVSEIRRGGHDMVTGRTAAAVLRVYRKIGGREGPSQRTRSYAARQGWVGPSPLLEYADIDEVLVHRACSGDAIRLPRGERLAAVTLLRDRGLSYVGIAARLRVTPRQIHRDLSDLGLITEGLDGPYSQHQA